MSVDDELPALPDPKNVALRADDCPQPEDLIENDRENRLVASTIRKDGEQYRAFRPRGAGLRLDESVPYLASTEWIGDVEEHR